METCAHTLASTCMHEWHSKLAGSGLPMACRTPTSPPQNTEVWVQIVNGGCPGGMSFPAAVINPKTGKADMICSGGDVGFNGVNGTYTVASADLPCVGGKRVCVCPHYA